MCTFSIEMIPRAHLEEVQVAIVVYRPLKVVPQVEFFNNLSNKTLIKCRVFPDKAFCKAEIPSLDVLVVVTFISNMGIPRSITKSFSLPLNLCVDISDPSKDNDQHKLILNLNQTPVGLSLLFPGNYFRI